MKKLIATLIAGLFATAAFAQTPSTQTAPTTPTTPPPATSPATSGTDPAMKSDADKAPVKAKSKAKHKKHKAKAAKPDAAMDTSKTEAR